ncbi:hypothetical protein ACHAXA_007068 [Cyclostephanos tholiformis]|uniref:Sulfotransferase n=1 Tax=Cyclostephanos tholiformis TaxID=382380 RepID=A0ABD3R8A4_9STRA
MTKKKISSSNGGRMIVYWVVLALALTHVSSFLNSPWIRPSYSPAIIITTTTTTIAEDNAMTRGGRDNIRATSTSIAAVVSTPPSSRGEYENRNDTELENSTPIAMPNDPRMYLIHVGKAGGTTLIRALRLSETINSVKCMAAGGSILDVGIVDHSHDDACYGRRSSMSSSELERRILGYYHMWGHGLRDGERTWLLENTNVFLYTVREPIDRLASAYNFHKHLYHGGNSANAYPRFYDECFPNSSFNDVIDALRLGTISEDCAMLGADVLRGRIYHGGGRHFRFNYEYYTRKTTEVSPDHAVAVIRTSELWRDASNLDVMIGGTGNFGDRYGARYTHGSDAYKIPYDGHLDVDNATYLCCLVYADMEAYQRLILRAANLDGTQKRETLNGLLRRCHIGTYANVDLVSHPFSWREFRYGRTCIDSLKTLKTYEMSRQTMAKNARHRTEP